MAHSTVLVVDDEAPIRELLRRWLEDWGYRVIPASNATDALERMFAQPASIISVDILMPGHDGFWLIERLRAKWRTPIILATGVNDAEAIKKSQQLGAVDYVLKPFSRDLLRQALDRAHASISVDRL